jgi:regulator of Ty1 transposition protein 103
MSLLYLANDIIQTSRKDGREFPEEFYKHLPKVLVHLNEGKDEKVKHSVRRLLKIWDERKVFGSSGIQNLVAKANFSLESSSSSPKGKSSRDAPRDPREAQRKEMKSQKGAVQKASSNVVVVAALREDDRKSKEVRALKALSEKIHLEAEELSAFERNNREALSTSEIVSGSSSDKVLDRYQNLIWKAMQNEKSLTALLDDWKGKVEESISKKEERVKQLKKDLLQRNNNKDAAASSIGAQGDNLQAGEQQQQHQQDQQAKAKVSSKQVAEKLLELGPGNAEALLKTFFEKPGNSPAKRMRSEL